MVERGTSIQLVYAEVYGSNPYGSTEAGWCSWLSRILNTDKVLGSNPSLVIVLLLVMGGLKGRGRDGQWKNVLIAVVEE